MVWQWGYNGLFFVPNLSHYIDQMLSTNVNFSLFQEHHLQQAIFHQRVIPVPEVYDLGPDEASVLDRLYPANYKVNLDLNSDRPTLMLFS